MISKRQIQHAIDESPTLIDAAAMLGVTDKTLRKMRKNYGMPVPASGVNKRNAKFGRADVLLIRALAEEHGMKADAIADKFDDRDDLPPVASVQNIIAGRAYKWVV